MSRWTHVAGVIRVDSLRLDGKESNDILLAQLKEIMGTPRGYGELEYSEDDEDRGAVTNTTLPCGSEGSLDYQIFLNDDYSFINAGSIVIYGDLRDTGGDHDTERIRKWFFDVCDKMYVRQAVIEIYDDYTGRKTFSYSK